MPNPCRFSKFTPMFSTPEERQAFFTMPVEDVPRNAALLHAAGTYIGVSGSSQKLFVDCVKIAIRELERDGCLDVNLQDHDGPDTNRRPAAFPTRRIDGGDVMHCSYFKDLFERAQAPVRDRAENDLRRCLGQEDDLFPEADEFEMPNEEFTEELLRAITVMWAGSSFQREHNTSDWINMSNEGEGIAEVDFVRGESYHSVVGEDE